MVKLPKALIKKYGISKKAWEVYRGTKKKKSGKKKRTVKVKRRLGVNEKIAPKRRKKSGTPSRKSKGVSTMPRKRKSVRAKARRAGRRIGAAMQTKPGKVLTYAAELTAGAVASSIVVNKAPVIKDQSKGAKMLAQGGLGLLAVMFVRNKHVKTLGAGSVIASIMGAVREYVKVEPLAGPTAGARTLTPAEIQRITSGQMNMPLPGNTMNVPMQSATGNMGFKRSGFGS